jgi:type II secretory pathway pseudopilin PulG
MKTVKCLVGLMIISMISLCAGPAFAWDTRWQFKQEAPSNSSSSSTRAIEMQKKFDCNTMNTFKGTIDNSNGYTVMRNLNGGTMRGYINKDGTGLLRDHNGNSYNVNTRW